MDERKLMEDEMMEQEVSDLEAEKGTATGFANAAEQDEENEIPVTDMERRGVAIRTKGSSPKQEDLDAIDEAELDDKEIEEQNNESKSAANPVSRGRIVSATASESRILYQEERIIPVGDDLSVISDMQARKQEYTDLLVSARSYRSPLVRNVEIMTGIVAGGEYNEAYQMAFVHIYYGHFMVKIPVCKLMKLDDDYEKRPRLEREKYLRDIMNIFAGAEIDYVVEQLDEMECIAFGDRLRAMEVKRARGFFTKRKSNNKPRINVGDLVEARVCGVQRRNLYIEYHGVQEVLSPEDVSYLRVQDLTREYVAGDVVTVRIKSLNRQKVNEAGEKYVVDAHASVKEAKVDPRVDAIKKIKVGDNKLGVVTLINTAGYYYIKLMNLEMEVMGRASGEFPNKPKINDRVLVRITGILDEKMYVYADIIRKL